MVQIKEISEKPALSGRDRSSWESFNLATAHPSFLQSWAWGQFQKKLGHRFFRLGIYDNRELVGISLIYVETAKLGSYLYCPAGPIFNSWKKQYLDEWSKYVENIAKKENAVFIRVDPRIILTGTEELLKEIGFVQAPEFTQPECSAVIDLTKSEEELRSNMSDSTRYNVNAAERKGVKVREGDRGEISIFLELLNETAKRKTLTLPAEADYHQKQFEVLEKEGLMRLFIAETSSQPLSAVLVVNYADTSYYLYAANSLAQRNLRASYPLVWHTILEAKKAGNKVFDFWGVAPNDDPKHPWAGVTAFKLSFGAERQCYEPPFDLPYKSNYQLMKVVEIWRKPVRKILRFGR